MTSDVFQQAVPSFPTSRDKLCNIPLCKVHYDIHVFYLQVGVVLAEGWRRVVIGMKCQLLALQHRRIITKSLLRYWSSIRKLPIAKNSVISIVFKGIIVEDIPVVGK